LSKVTKNGRFNLPLFVDLLSYSGFAMGAFSGVRGLGTTLLPQWGHA
jgi:hypothetical protein